MIAADKCIRGLLGDGSIEAEVAHRLNGRFTTAGSHDGSMPTTEARVQMAAMVTLKGLHGELEARPRLSWGQAAELHVLLRQQGHKAVVAHIRQLGGSK